MEIAVEAVLDVKEEKRKAKEERRAKKKAEKAVAADETAKDLSMDVDGEDKKDKKRKRRESGVNGTAQEVNVSVSLMFSLTGTHAYARRWERQRLNEKRGRRLARLRRLLPPPHLHLQEAARRVIYPKRKRKRQIHELYLVFAPPPHVICGGEILQCNNNAV
jgi:hypothetical protein